MSRAMLSCGWFGVLALVGSLAGCESAAPKPVVHYEPGTAEFYSAEVAPMFRSSCARCHMGMNHKGGLSLQTRAGVLRGGEAGAVVVAGEPDRSLLVTLVRHEPAHTGHVPEPGPMPDKGKRLSDAEIATIERWVKAGAAMPEDRVLP